jgi:hypothetical protein
MAECLICGTKNVKFRIAGIYPTVEPFDVCNEHYADGEKKIEASQGKTIACLALIRQSDLGKF